MSITIFLFFIVNLFTTLIPILSHTNHHHRRILHQPFFTPTTSPPSESPEPQTTPPKYPFSTFTPNAPPFFPLYPSPLPPPPPPPPSLTAFASNPVNISSLNVPKSVKAKTISPTLLAVTVISLILAVVIVAVAVFFYCGRRRKHFIDDDSKTYKSDNSRRLCSTPAGNVASAVNGSGVKLRSTSSTATSSEFLYLGTLVNSRRIDDIRGSSGGRKMDSPELQPLPPLSRQSYGNVGREGVIFKEEEDEEEFYSPRGSGSIATTRSGSRRVFPSTDVGKLVGTSSDSNRSSSSYSRSPADSISISISPLASLSPRTSALKSPPPLSRSLSPSVIPSPEKDLIVGPKLFNPPPPPPPPPRVIFPQSTSKPPRLVISPPIARPIEFRIPITVSPETVAVVEKNDIETPKPKLKPLHWDKVRASSDHAMVWDQLKSSSFKLDEEMIETLFVVNNSNSISKETTRRSVLRSPNQENRVLDPKKSQNIAISLRALNVTVEEVCEALIEGNADALGTELLESLLKMAPTKEEERKLKEYKEDSSFKLGTAEKFLREVLDIPFAFKRVDVMLYMSNFEAEVEYLKKSFQTLEVACEELRNSRIFLKLLEAVLKTGNRMNVGTNRGDAHAFKLDTLLKLVDVKGADGKTTLLHFVVQEIIRSEGARLSIDNQNPNSAINEDAKCRKLGLQVVSGLSSELCNVKKAAAMDSDVLSCEVVKLSKGIEHIREVVLLIKSNAKFSGSMNVFMEKAEEVIIRLQAEESVALSLVKEITEYFHGNSAKEEAHPFRIFLVVKDFLAVLERVCKDVGMINEHTIVSSANKFPVPVNPTQPASLTGYHRRQLYSSSDESSSP